MKQEGEANILFGGEAVGFLYVGAPAVDSAYAPHGTAEGHDGSAGGGELVRVTGAV